MRWVLGIALVAVRLYGALHSILSDCDEVYNYWEPLNMLTRYFGKKTWEYQPEYAIRSWTYLLPYAALKYPYEAVQKVLELAGILSEALPSYTFFYVVRVALALLFALAEWQLSTSLTLVSGELAKWFLVFQMLSPGVFVASVALLPSSFALIFGMFSTSAIIRYFGYTFFAQRVETDFIQGYKEPASLPDGTVEPEEPEKSEESDTKKPQSSPFKDLSRPQKLMCSLYKQALSKRDKHFTLAIVASSIGGLTGWPFSLVLSVPFIAYVALTVPFGKPLPKPLAVINNRTWTIFVYFLAGVSAVYMVSWIGSLVDFLFYNKTTIVPLNIVLYNVIHASADAGPSIFGVESSSYYFVNLLLNYHVIFVMALLNVPGILGANFRLSVLSGFIVYRLPALLWFTIFICQPHKEERFMYPIYHLISISGAVFACKCTHFFGAPQKRRILYYSAALGLFAVTALVGVLRIVSVIENYSAPLSAFKVLAEQPDLGEQETVCVGREWYHYPSSFFLKSNQRLKYVENGFRGMLPGDFPEPQNKTIGGLREAVSAEQTGFNNKNQYNADFVYSDLVKCDYYVDINMPVDTEMGEYGVFDEEGQSVSQDWSTLRCENLIDPDRSQGLAKLIHIPAREIGYLQAYWRKFIADERVVAAKKKLEDYSGYYDKVYEQVNDKVVQNPHVQKVYAQTSARLNELNAQVVLAAQVPGKVYYHKFCIAKRV